MRPFEKGSVDPVPVDTIAAWCGGVLEVPGTRGPVRGASIDGRSTRPGELFVALRGEKADGHAFAAQAESRGAAAILAEKNRASSLGLRSGSAVIGCEDPQRGLWKLAEGWRARLRARVAAVTGSFGKTTTKDLLAVLLASKGPAVKSPKSFNNALGLPLTILSADSSTWAMAVELGSNHPGEIADLCRLARPEVGVVTGIGSAHAGLLGGRPGILREKMDLPRSLGAEGTAVIPGGLEDLDREAGSLACRVLRFGERGDLDLRISGIEDRGWEGIRFTMETSAQSWTLSLPRLGAFQAANAAAAALAASALDIPLAESSVLLQKLPEPEGGRMRPRNVGVFRVLDDSYNSNPEAARAALAAFQSLPGYPRLAVLGDMLELGGEAPAEHRALGVFAAKSGIQGLIAVGSHAEDILEGAKAGGLEDVEAALDWTEASAALRRRLKPGAIILLKGSRRIGLERILKDMEA